MYSGFLVIMILNNLFIETLRKKDISECAVAGDRTGYSLTVTKHYRSMREKHGESVMKGQFVYSFALMDLITRMYIGYAVFLMISLKIRRHSSYQRRTQGSGDLSAGEI